MRIRGEYPQQLRAAIEHSGRLYDVLDGIEQSNPKAVWVRGRGMELRSVIRDALRSWREGATDEAGAVEAITKYLDTVHGMAAAQLGRSPVLECCRFEEAITAQGEDVTWPSPQQVADTDPRDAFETTLRAAWKDGPDTLRRVREEMARVEVHARALERRVGQACPPEDLRAFGREGLLDAARSFNEGRGIPFSAWASIRIRSAMIDGVRRWGSVPRSIMRELQALAEERPDIAGELAPSSTMQPHGNPISAEPGSIERTLRDGSQSPEELAAASELRTAMEKSLDALPGAEQSIVRKYYFEDQTLEEAAQSIGCGKSWASRLHARALGLLGRDLRAHQEDAEDQAALSR